MIHLYCLTVQADLYSNVVRVLDFRSKGLRLDPKPRHGDFKRVHDNGAQYK